MDEPLRQAIYDVALSRAVSDKSRKSAHALIPDGAAHDFDFNVRIQGNLTKGYETRSDDREADATCSLLTPDVVCELLDRLGVDKTKLKRTLGNIVRRSLKANDGKSFGDELADKHGDLLAVFTTVAQDTAAKLPKRTIKGTTRAGAIKVNATVTPL